MEEHSIRSFNRAVSLAIAIALLSGGICTGESTAVVPRSKLIEDARQLLETLEESHPDPHLAGGGRVAYHRRFHRMIDAIPDAGMLPRDFHQHLQPFVAAIRDSHTGLTIGEQAMQPVFLPLRFRVVELSLVVEEVAPGSPAGPSGVAGRRLAASRDDSAQRRASLDHAWTLCSPVGALGLDPEPDWRSKQVSLNSQARDLDRTHL